MAIPTRQLTHRAPPAPQMRGVGLTLACRASSAVCRGAHSQVNHDDICRRNWSSPCPDGPSCSCDVLCVLVCVWRVTSLTCGGSVQAGHTLLALSVKRPSLMEVRSCWPHVVFSAPHSASRRLWSSPSFHGYRFLPQSVVGCRLLIASGGHSRGQRRRETEIRIRLQGALALRGWLRRRWRSGRGIAFEASRGPTR